MNYIFLNGLSQSFKSTLNASRTLGFENDVCARSSLKVVGLRLV